MKLKVKSACNRDCPDACGIVATVDDGKVTRLQGDPDHPVTKGFLCHRTSRYLERQYSPERITNAMIRHNKKSGGQWQTVSNAEALDLVADKLLAAKNEFGPASILNYRCGGSMGMMKAVTDYFFQQMGPVTIKSGDICAGAGDWAQEQDFGTQDSNDFFDLTNAKTILIWGKNVFVSHVHLLPVLKKARAQGTKLILIDPVKHRTASICDQYIEVQPGGDAALAFAMVKYLKDHNRLDPDIDQYCDNLDEYFEIVDRHSVGQWASQAGVDEMTVAALAQDYANGPSTILVGWGMQRRRNGATIIRSIDALGAVSGNIGKPGACVSFYFPRRGAYDLSFIDDSLAPRSIPEPILGTGIEEATEPPIEVVFVSAANPVTNVPESSTTRRALMDRFTVVVDMFMTDTAETADVFLPAVSMLEDNDLVGAYGHHYLNKLVPIVPPSGNSMTDYEIIHELAKRVGLEDEFEPDPLEWQRRMTEPLATQGISLEQLEHGVVRNPFANQVVFEGRRFKTPSGKVNLMTHYSREATKADHQSVRLMALSTDQAQAAQWHNEQQTGLAEIRIHPDRFPEIQDGGVVMVKTRHGELKMIAKLNIDQSQQVALMDKGGWLSAGRCANDLIVGELSDHGECAVYYDTTVSISRLEN